MRNSQINKLPFAYPFVFPQHYKIGKFKYEGPFSKLARFYDDSWDREFTGMNPKLSDQNLVFDSTFESGNLDMVMQPIDKEDHFTCFIRPDTNSNGNLHWFYFSITGATNGQKVTLDIANFTKYTSLFKQGLKPSIFSWQKHKSKNIGWHRGGENLKYNKVIRRGRVFYSLEFEYTFEHDNDTVWFATSIPYTYSTLCKYIRSIESKLVGKAGKPIVANTLSKLKREYAFKQKRKQPKRPKICEIRELGTSLGGLSIPLLEITNYNWSKEEIKKRKIVLIWSRVHPGETNASWITHGIIDYLLGNSIVARELRNRLIFHIIPMINPDGVVVGNHRWSFIGKDINRWFEKPHQQLEPEPFAVRKHLKRIQKQAIDDGETDKVMIFADIHSHSNRKSIFMYGPHYPLHSNNYLNIRVIPKLMSERTNMFRFYSCKFRAEKYKENWARLSLWRGFGIQISITIESSFHGYLDDERETKTFKETDLQNFGHKFWQSVLEYCLIHEENQRQKLELAK